MNYITFNDVSQGDCIFIELGSDGGENIGLVDFGLKYIYSNDPESVIEYYTCHNHAVDFLRRNSIKQIDFITVSHPHWDHCVGLMEVLNYCDEHGVSIKSLVCPFLLLDEYRHLNNKHVKSVEGSDEKYLSSKLYKLLLRINDLRRRNVIENLNWLGTDFSAIFDGGVSIRAVAPKSEELSAFANKTKNHPSLQRKYDDGDLINILSIALVIRFKDTLIILTADTHIDIIDRIWKEEILTNILETTNLLIQIPHHGSGDENYFSDDVWNAISKVSNKVMVVVSNGLHEGYGHPPIEVVNCMIDTCSFDFYATNYGFGVKEKFAAVPTAKIIGPHRFLFDGISISKV
ncbi:MBL fold metallo-hydrolase [Parachryseolinea silvisoli]|uniref:MBL fold metallo-hydrolase n=1 Tax=Parachryseolinea silvisoli TaxID=2873601 RepID=UPI002265F866|nr:MBL fold metallo-hydrolase [Parachryseolinea silvisoli]MCD9015367.1 MBL fold metallo-hydrolase [Parachryseolinea silvisoli]